MRSKLAWLLAAAAIAAPPPPLQRLGVQSVEVAQVSTDRVRLRIHLDGVAEREISIRTLTFDDASLNGVPLFASPVTGPIRLTKGKRFSDVGAIEATVFYRDLPSLEPVRRMVRDEKAIVHATVRLQPDLSLLQRIALRSSSPWVSSEIERTVTVQLPGGRAGKTAVELALAGVDAVWFVGQRGWNWQRERDAFTQSVRQTYSNRVLPVKTTYRVAATDGTDSSLVWRGLAFHVGAGEVLAPAEAAEPWMFDGAIADASAAGKLEVMGESLEIQVGSFSLEKGTLAILTVGRDGSKGLSLERRKTFPLRDRSSTANVARFKVSMSEPLSPVVTSTDAGEVAIFRLREDGGTELLMLSAVVENGRIRLQDPVDSRAFGSPVIGANGVVGIVVGQNSIVPLPRKSHQQSAQVRPR